MIFFLLSEERRWSSFHRKKKLFPSSSYFPFTVHFLVLRKRDEVLLTQKRECATFFVYVKERNRVHINWDNFLLLFYQESQNISPCLRILIIYLIAIWKNPRIQVMMSQTTQLEKLRKPSILGFFQITDFGKLLDFI